MGAIGYLNGMVMAGTTTVIHMRFDPVKYVEDAVRVRRHRHRRGAPGLRGAAAGARVRRPDWSRVRGVSSGAAPLPVALIERLKALLPNAVIGEGYGLTEVTMQATGNPSFRSGTRKPGTVGVPVFDTEISIRPLGGGDAAARRRARRGLHPRPAGDARLRPPPGGHRRVDRRRRLVPLRRRRHPRRGRLPVDRRPHQGHAALQGLQRVPARAGGDPVRRARGGRRRGGRPARRGGRGAAGRLRRPQGRRRRRRADRRARSWPR